MPVGKSCLPTHGLGRGLTDDDEADDDSLLCALVIEEIRFGHAFDEAKRSTRAAR